MECDTIQTSENCTFVANNKDNTRTHSVLLFLTELVEADVGDDVGSVVAATSEAEVDVQT